MKIEWKIEIPMWDRLDKDTAKLYIDLANQKLAATVDNFKANTVTNNRLIRYYTLLLVSSLGVITSDIVGYLNGMAWVGLLCFVVGFQYLIRVIISANFATKGIEPKAILTKNNVENYRDSVQYANLTYQVLAVLQSKIEHNIKINEEMIKWQTKSKYVLFALPLAIIAFVVAFFITQLIM